MEHKAFSHMKGTYPHDGQTCEPESYGQPGDKGETGAAFGDHSSDDGYHDSPASKGAEAKPSAEGAIESSNPTKGEGSTGPVAATSHPLPKGTSDVGHSGVDHRPGRRPNAMAHE